MRITVCQLADTPSVLEREWPELKIHLAAKKSDMLVLPKMPFFSWPCSRKTFDPAAGVDRCAPTMDRPARRAFRRVSRRQHAR